MSLKKIAFLIVFILIILFSAYSSKGNNGDKDRDQDRDQDRDNIHSNNNGNNKIYNYIKIEKKRDHDKDKIQNIIMTNNNILDSCILDTDNLDYKIIEINKDFIKGNKIENELKNIVGLIVSLKIKNKNMLKEFEKDQKKLIVYQIKNIEQIFKEIDKYIEFNKKEDRLKIIRSLELNIDKLNRQYRAINWILYEQ